MLNSGRRTKRVGLPVAGAQRSIVHVDEELLGNERDAARRNVAQAVVENVFERLPKEGMQVVDGWGVV